MKLWIGLALAFLCGCAGAHVRRPSPKDVPLDERKTFGPSRVIYWK